MRYTALFHYYTGSQKGFIRMSLYLKSKLTLPHGVLGKQIHSQLQITLFQKHTCNTNTSQYPPLSHLKMNREELKLKPGSMWINHKNLSVSNMCTHSWTEYNILICTAMTTLTSYLKEISLVTPWDEQISVNSLPVLMRWGQLQNKNLQTQRQN